MLQSHTALLSAILLVVCCAPAESGANGEKPSKYIYSIEKRSDPFQPFLVESLSPDSPVDPPRDRGGVPFEPGQLKLATVISVSDGRKALAEDVAGKGYFLYKGKGLPIGKYGVVKKNDDGQVVIVESYHTASGRLVSKETVMRLKTEGE